MLGPQAALNGSGVVVYDGSLYDRNDSVSATLSQPSQCLGWVTLASAAVGPQHWYDRLAANVEWVPRGNRAVALSTCLGEHDRSQRAACSCSRRLPIARLYSLPSQRLAAAAAWAPVRKTKAVCGGCFQ